VPERGTEGKKKEPGIRKQIIEPNKKSGKGKKTIKMDNKTGALQVDVKHSKKR